MADQERKQTSGDQEEVVEETVLPEGQGDELTEKIDDLLEEIDSVLEENAEEFVKNYVQKGGE
jgi:ubiquitin-like protein Pup